MKNDIFLIILFSGILIAPNISLAYEIPSWIRTTTGFWCDGFVNGEWNDVILIQNLIDYRVIEVPENEYGNEKKKFPAWIKNTVCWWVDGLISDDDFFSGLQFLANKGIIVLEKPQSQLEPQKFCSGIARCFVGTVSEIIDGDTIRVDGKSIRFTLVHTPERGETGFSEAKDLVASICPVGSSAIVDEDDEQTKGSYGRIIAVVYCNGKNLNESVLEAGLGIIRTEFCLYSEFSHFDWVEKYGCPKAIP